jgi:small subunit ribosomal protein S16
MVIIRLSRHGSKKKPFYKIIVADSRMPRNGRYIEKIGTYNPKKQQEINIKINRAIHWISIGAKTSNTVKSLIKKYKNNSE